MNPLKYLHLTLLLVFVLPLLSVGQNTIDSKHKVSGIVKVWRQNKPIAGVTIMTAGAKQTEVIHGVYGITNGVSTVSDSAGKFELYLPDSMIGKKITLLFHKNNYRDQAVIIKTWKLPAKVKAKMEGQIIIEHVHFL